MGGMTNMKTEKMNMESGNYEWEELPSLPIWTDEEGYTHDQRLVKNYFLSLK